MRVGVEDGIWIGTVGSLLISIVLLDFLTPKIMHEMKHIIFHCLFSS